MILKELLSLLPTDDVTTQSTNEETKPTENPRTTETQSEWTSDDQFEDESESDATVCEFVNDHSVSNDYNSVMMINFNVIVDLGYRNNLKEMKSIEQIGTLEQNRICNHLIRVTKVLQAKHFDETVWCKDNFLFSAEPQALSNLSVYIPIESPIHGFTRGCVNLLQDNYQSLLDRHVSYAFSRTPQTSRITVTIARVELLEKENVIMQDPWPPKWDDTARTLLAAVDANDILPIRRVHTDVTFNEKKGLKSYSITLSFSIEEKLEDGGLVRHTLDQVKQHVDVTKYLTGERLNGKMNWKEWIMKVHVVSTLDTLKDIVENLGPQLSQIFENEGLTKHIISRSIVRSSRFGDKARFGMQIVLNLYSLMEEQPKLAEEITGTLSAISSRLQESMKNHNKSFRISPECCTVTSFQWNLQLSCNFSPPPPTCNADR
ncbi:unnamed protein product [Echinostoma caproni]|uniref:ALOG domain-containing protein n=1 Tax=Echinostoma caproni TaxID=27848 RepID=A0A183AGY5_9TREM|nr:unnamed protein product [Echinostoma caproni]